MPPSNTSFATAISIPSFPYDTTQDVSDGGVNYTVYYKFTAPSNGLIFFFGYGASLAGGYTVQTNAYLGPAGAPTGLIFGHDDRPIQLQVTSGQEYFLEFEKRNDLPLAIISISGEFLAQQALQAGDFIINDDTDGFPAIVVSYGGSYSVVASFGGVVAGEAGDATDDNIMAFSDEWNNTLVIYDADFNELNSLDTTSLGTPFIRTMNGEKFYVGFDPAAGDVRVRDVLDDGTFGAVDFYLDSNTSIRGIAPNNDETILYFANSAHSSAVKRWDIVNDLPLSNFVSGFANEYVVDILVLSDDSIVILYNRLAGDAFTNYIRRYNAGGTLLTTFEYTSENPANTFPRLSFNADRSNFWLMAHEDSGTSVSYGSGITKIIQFDLATGLQTTLLRYAQYEAGAYTGPVSADPPQFGVSFSCPLITRRGNVPPPTDPDPLISQIAIEVLTLPPTLAGIYYIDVTREVNQDQYYTETLKIPNPTVRTALIGE